MALDEAHRPRPSDPEYRRDAVTGQWIIVSSERAQRPISLESSTIVQTSPSVCPFCEGSEDMTPPELDACRDGSLANAPGWRLRVVPNRFPAVRKADDFSTDRGKADLGRACVGLGHHELIVETPRHLWTISNHDDEHWAKLFELYQRRMVKIRSDPSLRYGLLFKNAGPAAGASQEHSHTQVLATTTIPPRIQDELNGAAGHYATTNRCIFCDLMHWELEQRVRIVAETEDFVAWCPFASRFPYEIWIAPRSHEAHFPDVSPAKMGTLGALVKRLLLCLESEIDCGSYNYYIHTAPFTGNVNDHYHWHLELMPRLVGLAGFEVGGGMFINPLPPEWSAKQWREALRVSVGK